MQSALKTSFSVSYRISKCLKLYTVGKELISPSAIDICTKITDEKVANQFKNILLSDNTIARRISFINNDLKVHLSSQLSTGKFSLQLDESTVIKSEAIFLTYVRYFYQLFFFITTKFTRIQYSSQNLKVQLLEKTFLLVSKLF